MTLAYRKMLMEDKSFKTEFDNTQKFNSGLDTAQKLIDEYEKSGKSTSKLKEISEKVARSL